MALELTILGCGAATPTSQRNPTAQVLQARGRFFLIDCGEGTQLQLIKNGVRAHKINHIFISHLHGDHYLGLMGLLSSLHLFGRTKEMHLYCPEALQGIIELQLHTSNTELRYTIVYHFHKEGVHEIFSDELISIQSFPLDHRIPCWGFRFNERERPRNIKKEKLGEYRIPVSKIDGIKWGDDFITEDGRVILNEELTLNPEPPKSYAFCSDTKKSNAVIQAVKGVNLLYHEATFLSFLEERAEETFHSTAMQAGEVAKEAGVKQLLIGHYSSRYRQTEELLAEAKTAFQNTLAAEDGLVLKF